MAKANKLAHSNKPPQVKQAVIAKRLAGDSKLQIAKDLGINPNTVRKILTESQVEQAVVGGRSALVELVPKAIRLIGRAIDQGMKEKKGIPKPALEAAIQVIKGSGVYEERSRTRGDITIHDEYANADTERLRNMLDERLNALGSNRVN